MTGKAKIVLLVCVALVGVGLAGCAKKVNKDWVPTGGSRADATIELSYEFNPELEIPQLNEQQGLELAVARCRSWGYHSAEPFGGVKSVCNKSRYQPFGGTICYSEFVTKQYQCLGQGAEVPGQSKP